MGDDVSTIPASSVESLSYRHVMSWSFSPLKTSLTSSRAKMEEGIKLRTKETPVEFQKVLAPNYLPTSTPEMLDTLNPRRGCRRLDRKPSHRPILLSRFPPLTRSRLAV